MPTPPRIVRGAPRTPVTAPARIVRTAARTARVTSATAAVDQAAQRAQDIADIEESLQSIADLKIQMAELQDKVTEHEASILAKMKRSKIADIIHAGLQAILAPTFSNEKKEIDPLKLFNKKGINRSDFFKMVKVQIGEVGKYLAENEIRELAKITPPQKTGEALTIKPVKAAASKTVIRNKTR
jgi:hypothetical protein